MNSGDAFGNWVPMFVHFFPSYLFSYSKTIVMLTKIFDFMRVVCLQYWPQTQFQFGEIHVETMETRTYAHFVIRTFRLRKTGGVGELGDNKGTDQCAQEERIVKHFHFTEWELVRMDGEFGSK